MRTPPTELRTRLAAAKADYHHARYPGDLADDVLRRRRRLAPFWLTLGTALAASVALVLWLRPLGSAPGTQRPTPTTGGEGIARQFPDHLKRHRIQPDAAEDPLTDLLLALPALPSWVERLDVVDRVENWVLPPLREFRELPPVRSLFDLLQGDWSPVPTLLGREKQRAA